MSEPFEQLLLNSSQLIEIYRKLKILFIFKPYDNILDRYIPLCGYIYIYKCTYLYIMLKNDYSVGRTLLFLQETHDICVNLISVFSSV